MKKYIKYLGLLCIMLIGIGAVCLLPKEESENSLVTTNNQAETTYNDLFLKAPNLSNKQEPIAYYSDLGSRYGYENYTSNPHKWCYSNMTYNVVFMNFNDKTMFTAQNYTQYAAKFDEVAKYISMVSRDITTVNFNYCLYNNSSQSVKVCDYESDYNREANYISAGLNKGVRLSNEYRSSATGNILMIAHSGSYNSMTLAHPHVWDADTLKTRYMIVNADSTLKTIAHELLHTLGLGDLYNINGISARTSDIMDSATGEFMDLQLNAYSRYSLGWLSQSEYDDNIETCIENIYHSGRYALNDCYSKSGTMCYKFGVRGSESFYLEVKPQDLDSGTISIHKVNTLYNSNYSARSEKEFHIITNDLYGVYYGNTNHKTIISPSSNPLKYSDGTILNVTINNVFKDKNGITYFDIYMDNSNPQIQCDILVVDEKTHKPIKDVKIYINDVYQTVTDLYGNASLNVQAGDKVKFIADGYLENTLYLTANDVNMHKKHITRSLTASTNNKILYKINCFIQYQNKTYQVPANEIYYFANGVTKQYPSGGRQLKTGESFILASYYFENKHFTFEAPCLISNSDCVCSENYTFNITLPAVKTYNYRINLYNDNEMLVSVNKVKIYNTLTNSWEQVGSLDKQNSYYIFESLPALYNRIGFEYEVCGIISTHVVFIDYNKVYYEERLEKNPLQLAGDVMTSIGTGIIDVVDDLWNNIQNIFN